jgi:hypothetical protein
MLQFLRSWAQGFFTLSTGVYLVALIISSIAAFYSVIGLTSIYSAAFWPIVFMGGSLEVGKIATTLWLKRFWNHASWMLKVPLVSAVIVLAIITSMGIFGFLSKAHTDQNLVSGDVLARIAIYDEKIRISKENIDANRAALKQLDAAVDQIMGRSTTESGAERSVQIRRQQGSERQRLIREIEAEQKKISSLNEERAPIAAEVRKVEAEVGPIKYIAALIYGDDPDTNLLERAVRWFTIVLVAVFDPLALVLIIAVNSSYVWEREQREREKKNTVPDNFPFTNETDGINNIVESNSSYPADDGPLTDDQIEQIKETAPTPQEPAYLKKPGIFFNWKPFPKEEPVKEEPVIEESVKEEPVKKESVKEESVIEEPVTKESVIEEPVIEEPVKEEPSEISTYVPIKAEPEIEIVTENVTTEPDYIARDGKNMSRLALDGLDSDKWPNQITFGERFPVEAIRGDTHIITKTRPHRVYKFTGNRWMQIDKNINVTYLTSEEYLTYLLASLANGTYSLDFLTEYEQQSILEANSKSDK